MNSEEITKDIVVAWLSNSELLKKESKRDTKAHDIAHNGVDSSATCVRQPLLKPEPMLHVRRERESAVSVTVIILWLIGQCCSCVWVIMGFMSCVWRAISCLCCQ